MPLIINDYTTFRGALKINLGDRTVQKSVGHSKFCSSASGNMIFDILEQSSFQKHTTCWVFLALPHMLYLCICVFVNLYFCICAFSTWEYNFWYPWTILFSKIYHMFGLSGTWSYAVFVYLCICEFIFFVFVRSACGNIIFDILEQSSFQKYTTRWVFRALCNMLTS